MTGQRSRSVIVVEDDTDQCELIAAAFRREGWQVEAFDNGRDAFEHLVASDEVPALVILDLELPIMTGWEFLDLVRRYSRWANLPIFIVSAHSAPAQALLAPAVTAYFQKPQEPRALATTVLSMLERESSGKFPI